MRVSLRTFGLFFAFNLILAGLAGSSSAQEKKVDPDHAKRMAAGLKLFKSDVKPVLVGRCLKCHGGDEKEGGLDLSSRKSLLAGGSNGPTVVIGKAQSSLLYRTIAHSVEPNMPEDGAKLDQRHIDAIAKWIDLGAPYDHDLGESTSDPLGWTRKIIDPSVKTFWSFQHLKKVTVPKIRNGNWCRTDIDRFLADGLHKKGMSPNPPVERAKLARRMYLGMIGLPPTPQQISEFVSDTRPDAIDRLIEKLLASQHFGEKWARHWLDIARFAESHGFEQDYNRPHAYHYRDFVIKAFNEDMPYDQFVKWQLAGDELNPENPLALMATGFLGAGVFPTQLTEKEFEPARYDELDDMAATIGTAMMGITIGCARCHDHKFDPIPQRDYYRFISAFTSTIRTEVELELNPGAVSGELSKWQNQLEELEKQLVQYEKEKLSSKFEKWLLSKPKSATLQPSWIVLDVANPVSTGGATFKKLEDGSWLATGNNPDFDSYEFRTTTSLSGMTAIRIEALADASMVRKGPGRASNGNFGLGTLTVSVRTPGAKKPIQLKLIRPRSTFEQNNSNLSIAASIDGNPKTGWAVDPQFGKNHAAIFDLETPAKFKGDTELIIRMDFGVNNKHNIGRPRISVSHLSTPPGFTDQSERQSTIEILKIMKQSRGKLTDVQRRRLFDWYRTTDNGWNAIQAQLQEHRSKKPTPVKTKVMISSEGRKPLKHHADGRKFPHFYKQTYFLKRGDTTQKQGEANPGLLQVFSSQKKFSDFELSNRPDSRLSYRRSALANWMTDTEFGPGEQLARVIVNRIWQHHFGQGIVGTPNDFGFQGARPTHPELLDWLAQKLIDEKWSLKAIHRLILQSAVYQQSSEFDQQDSAKDPVNRFLWRFSPRRLEAEIIRDSMLSVSGTLDKRMYGEGTLDERMKRRSIYFMIKRSRLIPMMQIFDSPEPLVSVGARPTTTIAPQALLFMNNANVREYAKHFARQVIQAADRSPEEKRLEKMVQTGFLMALGRKPSEEESKKNLRFIKKQIESYQSEEKPEGISLAITDFCQVLFCLNEFIYID